MHELGIIVHITKTLTGVAEENRLSEIASVTLEVLIDSLANFKDLKPALRRKPTVKKLVSVTSPNPPI